MRGKTYGYVRISSKDQNEERQLIAMRNYNIKKENIYVDKISGRSFERPEYKKLIKKLKKGDILVVKSIDRLGRNYKEIIEQWRLLTKERGVEAIVLDMPLLDTTKCKDLLGTLIADLVLQLLSYVSEYECETIRQRQMEGILAAKARGVRFGRAPKNLPDNFESLYHMWKDKMITAEELAFSCNMSRSGLFKKLKQYKDKQNVK